MNKGDFLIAIDPCKMNTGEKALTLNKCYPIVEINNSDFYIIDDQGSRHSYDLYEESEAYWGKFFKLATTATPSTDDYVGNSILIPEVGKSYLAIHKDHHKYPGVTVPISKVKCEGGTFYKDSLEYKPVIRFPNNVIVSYSNYLLFDKMEDAVKHLKDYYRK